MNNHLMTIGFGLALVATSGLASEGPEAPPPPARVESGETLEPEVTIIESDKGTLYEYRINGNLYMIKVQPMAGPPYYLLDTNGDGIMDAREDRPYNTGIPQWVLLSW